MGNPTYTPAVEAAPAVTKENTTYRKKPVLINALEWRSNADNAKVKSWVELFGDDYAKWFKEGETLQIETLESNGNVHTVSEGDFIIRGVAGEYYPCKGDIFTKTYEKELALAEIVDVEGLAGAGETEA